MQIPLHEENHLLSHQLAIPVHHEEAFPAKPAGSTHATFQTYRLTFTSTLHTTEAVLKEKYITQITQSNNIRLRFLANHVLNVLLRFGFYKHSIWRTLKLFRYFNNDILSGERML